MFSRSAIFSLFIFCAIVCSSESLHADSGSAATAESKNYVRLKLDDKTAEPVALETSIETLTAKDSRGAFKVDLVAAVHIAEVNYYKDLNKRFEAYDSVLYELVADPSIDRAVIGHTSSSNPLSISQKIMQNMLGLSFQLEQINYQAKNFVHADMSPDQFNESMQKRGESIVQMLLKVALGSMANADNRPPPDLSDLLMMGFSQTRAAGLRRSLARQFQDMETMLGAINGAEGSTIISERNKVAISVAKSELEKGKRKLAIFYGGAHMPNMKEQLEALFSAKATSLEWLVAWDLKV